MRGDLRRLTEGKLHVRDCENPQADWAGNQPTIQVQTRVSRQDRSLFSL